MENRKDVLTNSGKVPAQTEEQLLGREFQPTPQEEFEDTMGDDPDLLLFLFEWLGNGCNGTRAYLSLRPTVTEQSARVLASKKLAKLAKVNIVGLLGAYGIGVEHYMILLKQGLLAMVYDPNTKQLEPDLKARRIYHQALGRLLGLE